MIITVSVRSERLTSQATKNRMRHNFREPVSTQRVKYLKTRKPDINKFYHLNVSQNKAYHRDYPFPNFDKNFSDGLIEDKMAMIRESYESQTDSKGRKKTLRKNSTLFEEHIITFGIQREDMDRNLTQEETDYINSKDYEAEVEKFIISLSNKYGNNDFWIACHRDENIVHYQIISTRYDFQNKTIPRFKSKIELAQYGTDLQDMAAEAFRGKAVRGVKGSARPHIKHQKFREIAELQKQKEELERANQELMNKIHQLERKERSMTPKMKDTGIESLKRNKAPSSNPTMGF